MPAGLVPASFESLHAINDQLAKSARSTTPQQDASPGGFPDPVSPKYVFYAARKSEWDGHQINIPSIEISALPAPTNTLDEAVFKKDAETSAAAYNLKILGSISEFTANHHQFLRTDFEHSIRSLHVYKSRVRTSAGAYMLDIEINAYSLDELQQVAGFLQTISIAPENQ